MTHRYTLYITIAANALILLAACSQAADNAAPPADSPPPAASENGESSESAEFSMEITDRFRIASGGIVVAGQIESGRIAIGDSICIRSADGGRTPVEVTGIESFNKLLDSASAGDRVGLLVTGIELATIAVGDHLTPSCD